jgi:hypothetical protein
MVVIDRVPHSRKRSFLTLGLANSPGDGDALMSTSPRTRAIASVVIAAVLTLAISSAVHAIVPPARFDTAPTYGSILLDTDDEL